MHETIEFVRSRVFQRAPGRLTGQTQDDEGIARSHRECSSSCLRFGLSWLTTLTGVSVFTRGGKTGGTLTRVARGVRRNSFQETL